MWNRKALLPVAAAFILATAAAHAGDEEGCGICHRLELRRSSAEGGAELKVSDPAGGPHDGLYCSDCHVDAKTAPHPFQPGPAGCIGECHIVSSKARGTHRTASFGGLTESHRKLSAPRAPCLLCHGSHDRTGSLASVVRRCGGCHPKERSSAARGVHARIGASGEEGYCSMCHTAHPEMAKERQIEKRGAVCGGKGCHAVVTPRMKSLGGHDTGGAGAGAKAAVFLAVVGLGVLSGRRFGGAGRRENGK